MDNSVLIAEKFFLNVSVILGWQIIREVELFREAISQLSNHF